MAAVSSTGRHPALLCVSQSFSPETTPTAIRAGKLLANLSRQWDISVVTESQGPPRRGAVQVHPVRGRRPKRLFAALRRVRLEKLIEILVWPDDAVFWVLPAIVSGWRVLHKTSPSAIVVFMMPYSGGLVGVVLSWLTGLPLILNLDDSPTCTDMHPYFPTRWHYRLARALEDFYVRSADAVVYVSQTNLDTVRGRSPEPARDRFHLVRYGADRAERSQTIEPAKSFDIAYVGAMTGWWALIDQSAPTSRLERMHEKWTRLGRYELAELDQRTSSPAIIGGAILDVTGEHPTWSGRVKLTIHGNPYPTPVVARALACAGVESVVNVLGPVSHDEVANLIRQADLLFLTLPRRADGSRGGRISAKTYEYLATNRPILAAVPRGENWDFLADKPGVWLVDPDDRQRMTDVIEELAGAKFAGMPRTFARDDLYEQLSYRMRSDEFGVVLRAGIEHSASRGTGRRPWRSISPIRPR